MSGIRPEPQLLLRSLCMIVSRESFLARAASTRGASFPPHIPRVRYLRGIPRSQHASTPGQTVERNDEAIQALRLHCMKVKRRHCTRSRYPAAPERLSPKGPERIGEEVAL